MNYRLYQNDLAKEIAVDLLKAGAIKLNKSQPFTWSSGWKSPIYCDNRVTLSYPETRKRITKALSNVIIQEYQSVEAVSGVATAGIPQGALVAGDLDLPFSYVRSKPKGHGMENLIEGRLVEGQKVAVVEDLISTGGSSLKAVDAIRKVGAKASVLLAIFNYGFDLARQNCEESGVDVVYLSDYETMLPVALEMGMIKSEDMESLQAWRKNPASWGA